MKKILTLLFILIATTVFAHLPPTGIQDEGGTETKPVFTINCVGAGISCNHSGTTGTLTVTGGGGGGEATNLRFFQFTANGPYIVDTAVDGARIPDDVFTISAVRLHRADAGTSGSTTIDINVDGSTIYSTQGNRPSIAFNDGDNNVDATLPDTLEITTGQIITIDTDAVEAGTPQNYTLMIEGS